MLTGSASPSSLFLSTFQLTLGAEKLGQCDTSHHRFTVTPPLLPQPQHQQNNPPPLPPLARARMSVHIGSHGPAG